MLIFTIAIRYTMIPKRFEDLLWYVVISNSADMKKEKAVWEGIKTGIMIRLPRYVSVSLSLSLWYLMKGNWREQALTASPSSSSSPCRGRARRERNFYSRRDLITLGLVTLLASVALHKGVLHCHSREPHKCFRDRLDSNLKLDKPIIVRNVRNITISTFSSEVLLNLVKESYLSKM